MAQPSNLYDTYDTTGIREDLVDVIYNISPEDTPILSAIPRPAAKSTKHEWQLDALAAPAANAVIEGDEATTDAMTATTRAFNFTQISDKVIALSGTQSAVDAAGRADEMAYQIAKKSKELKKDMEFSLIKGQVQAAGDASNARKLGSIPTGLKLMVMQDLVELYLLALVQTYLTLVLTETLLKQFLKQLLKRFMSQAEKWIC